MEPECYQLKWHSFEAHMQACVATLLHSETFADVVLSTADGRHISGHRFVLAASSTYLQRLLGQGSMVAHNHLPVVVILPPEVTYHALCLLVKYMYSGEATVPNSQLSAVLRAGDILKVRGLWRPNQHGGGGHGPHGPTAAPGASASAGVTASGRPHHIVEAMQNCMRRGPGAPPAVAGFHAARERERPAASSRAARAARQDYAASSATSAAASAASAAGLGVHRHFMDPSSIPVRAGHRHGPTAGLDMTSADDAGLGAGREVGHEDPEHAVPHPRPRGPGRPPLHQSRLASRRGVKDYRDSKDDIKARRREVRRRERIHLAARAAAAAAAAPAEKPVANGILGSVQAPDEHPGLQQAEKAAVADKDKEGGPDVKVEGAEERTTKRDPDRSISPRRGVSPRSVSPRRGVSPRSVSPRRIVSPKASPRGSAGDDSGCEDRDDPGRTKPCKDEDGDGARTILDGIGALANLVVGEMRIKEEPIEWDLESEVREALLDEDHDGGRDHDPELHVKPEAMDTGEADGERGDGLMYSPLSCEICQVTFYSPAEWVRHAESEHGELRRRPRRRAHKGRQSSHDSDRSAMSASRAASTSSERTNAGTPGPAGSAASAGSSSGVTTPASAASSSGASAPLRPRLGGQGLGQGGQGPYAELVCDVCDETFSSPALWARHMQSSHTDEELAVHNRAVRPSQPLRTYGPRVPHHHPSRNYASNNNNSSSSSSGSGSSSRHQGHGHGPPGSNKPLKTTLKRCGMCSKAFLSKASLQIHRRTHTGERPFVCHRCGYGFSVKSNLVRHIRTLHNGDDLNGDPQDPQDPALQDGLDDPVGGGGGSGFDDEGCGDGDGDATNGTE